MINAGGYGNWYASSDSLDPFVGVHVEEKSGLDRMELLFGVVICMSVWNSGMRRGKAFILTVCSFTSESVMSYNQYLLESINMGDASACAWRLGRADLQADLTAVEVFELVYQNSIKDIEMGEMYSNSVFTLTPALPAGIVIYSNTI